MTTSVLNTKLYIPSTRTQLVPRPHLVEQLNAGLHRKLTLISAPAGFGKTTLVTEWVAGCGRPVAWLSLDGGDNDKTRFLTYLVTALQTIDPMIGKGVLRQIQSPQPPPIESILTDLLNDITSIDDNFILVLDDHHVIDAEPVNDALTFLIEHMPPQMHLVIATRDDPQLPLARLRARSQMAELRAADLRFSTSEVSEFLNQVMGLDLSAADIIALEARTEGWITGLQLAAISMQGSQDTAAFIEAFTGSHRYVLDYLIEEVLDQQAEDIRSFLLQTAVLDRLEGSLCNALTGQDNGQQTLEHLERANLFIVPLDDERRWYRYHHLFADLVRQRLNHTQPEQLPTLHCRASEWYEQNGFVDQAIEHALRGEDFEKATSLLEDEADLVWGRGEHTKLNRWLAKLPRDMLLSSPQFCMLQAANQLSSGQLDAAEQSLLVAKDALARQIELETKIKPTRHDHRQDSIQMKIQARIAALWSQLALYRGDWPEIQKYSQLALENLPERDFAWRNVAAAALGDAFTLMGELEQAYRVRLEAVRSSRAAGNDYIKLVSIMKLAVTLRAQGRLGQIVELFQQESQLANESVMSQKDVFGCILAVWGEVLAELNDLEGAIDRARTGVELAERGKDVAIIGWSYVCLMRVLFSLGDFASAKGIYQKVERIDRELGIATWITDLLGAWRTRIWLVEGNLELSSQWALERGLRVDGELTYLRMTEYVVLVRLLIAQGNLDEASGLLERLFTAIKAGGNTTRLIEILLLQAMTFQAGGDTTRALSSLEHALNLAEPEGFIRTFVDEGPPMARLLYEALSQGIMPDYVCQLLAAFPIAETEQDASAKYRVDQSELIEPLSEREIEVLLLIAEGLTNQEIASRLYLSLNTVKVHTRNINGKLGVHNRTQAVARAKALGIVPPI